MGIVDLFTKVQGSVSHRVKQRLSRFPHLPSQSNQYSKVPSEENLDQTRSATRINGLGTRRTRKACWLISIFSATKESIVGRNLGNALKEDFLRLPAHKSVDHMVKIAYVDDVTRHSYHYGIRPIERAVKPLSTLAQLSHLVWSTAVRALNLVKLTLARATIPRYGKTSRSMATNGAIGGTPTECYDPDSARLGMSHHAALATCTRAVESEGRAHSLLQHSCTRT